VVVVFQQMSYDCGIKHAICLQGQKFPYQVSGIPSERIEQL
jgi:hypothetical protein